MPVSTERLLNFEEQLRNAGIPVIGISVVDQNTNPPTLRIDLSPDATPAQRLQAETIRTTQDWRRRRKRQLAALVQEYRNLSAAQKTQAQERAIALLAREFPAVFAGLLSGDEPES
jgi:hypothetical protein